MYIFIDFIFFSIIAEIQQDVENNSLRSAEGRVYHRVIINYSTLNGFKTEYYFLVVEQVGAGLL